MADDPRDRDERRRRFEESRDRIGYGMEDYARRRIDETGVRRSDRREANRGERFKDDFGFVGRGYEEFGFDRTDAGDAGDDRGGSYGSGPGPRMRGGFGGEGYNSYGEDYRRAARGAIAADGPDDGPGDDDRGYQSDRGDRYDPDRRGDRGLFRGGGRIPELPDEGPHRGRGPRNYQRSDDRIREDVNQRLTDDPYVDASDIEVGVENREVTLTGTVASRSDKRRAEDIADSVSGVTHVQNNLRVQWQAGTAGRTTFGNATADQSDVGGGGTTASGTPPTAGTSAASGTTGTSGASGARTGEGTDTQGARNTSGRTDDTGSAG